MFVGYYYSDVALKRCGVSVFLFVSVAEPHCAGRRVKLGLPPIGAAKEQASDQHVCPQACHQRENVRAYDFLKCNYFYTRACRLQQARLQVHRTPMAESFEKTQSSSTSSLQLL